MSTDPKTQVPPAAAPPAPPAAPKPDVVVEPAFPAERLAAPYANATYTFPTGSDVTLVFMRFPALSKKRVEEIKKEPGPYEAPIVASVTLPKDVALVLYQTLKENLGLP